eukprot:IDg13230t1
MNIKGDVLVYHYSVTAVRRNVREAANASSTVDSLIDLGTADMKSVKIAPAACLLLVSAASNFFSFYQYLYVTPSRQPLLLIGLWTACSATFPSSRRCAIPACTGE